MTAAVKKRKGFRTRSVDLGAYRQRNCEDQTHLAAFENEKPESSIARVSSVLVKKPHGCELAIY
jgi:hypothetical protein